MIIITGSIRIAPDRLAGALPAMSAMMIASRAEPGCVAYAYAQDLLDPGLIHVVERWRDRAALAAHFASPHLGISNRQLDLVEGDPEPT
jgi:quinol monooxygenase YgiN